MKSILLVAAYAIAAFAQSISIINPEPFQWLRTSEGFVVTLKQASGLSSLEQVSVAIAVRPCYDVPCPSTFEGFGMANIIYNGPFHPQWSIGANGFTQTFFFEGDVLQLGQNIFSVVHFANIGARHTPMVETRSVVVNVTEF